MYELDKNTTQVKLFPSKITTPMTPFTTQNTSSRRWSQSGVLKSDSFCGCKVSPGVDRKFSSAKVDGEGKTEKFIWSFQEYQHTVTEISSLSVVMFRYALNIHNNLFQ